MSSLPLLLSLIDELDREANSPYSAGEDFGLGLHPHHIHRLGHNRRLQQEPSPHNLLAAYALPLGLLAGRQAANRHGNENSRTAVSRVGRDGFQVCMDVTQFKPNEVSVKVVNDFVVVEGKHEEREDEHGFISRHFVRRYALPKDYDPDLVVSTLSSDGVLTIKVPKPQARDSPTERVIHIQQTGPAHLSVRANSSEETNGTDVEK